MMEKYRHELKYLISQGQLVLLRHRLSGLVPIDPHAGADGRYNIRSLYFDDYADRCYYENLSGADPRDKFRIRIYNHKAERITLECKRKESAKTLKTSCPLTRGQCESLMAGQYIGIPELEQPVFRKFTLEMMVHRMHPVVIVEYDRIPYVYRNGNVRITLDTNISSSQNLRGFLNEIIPKRPVMPAGMHLLEVKYDEYLPDFIYRALQLENLQQTAYSKYFLCRQYTL
jgi:hypothetical protein